MGSNKQTIIDSLTNDLSSEIKDSISKSISIITTDLEISDYIKESIMDILFDTQDGTVSNTKKNFKKNRQNVVNLLLKPTNVNHTISFLESINSTISNYLFEHEETINSYINNLNIPANELDKLSTFMYSFIEAVSINDKEFKLLKELMRSCYYDKNLFVGKNVPKDTLKKYYFSHVLDLKNSVKIFNTDNMIYGETNNIMRIFNRVTEFLFSDFVFYYNTLLNILNVTKELKK